MRVATIQMSSDENKDRNMRMAEKLVGAAARDADVLLLPELFTFLGPDAETPVQAESEDGPAVSSLREWASKHGKYLIGGSLLESRRDEAGETRYDNSVMSISNEELARFAAVEPATIGHSRDSGFLREHFFTSFQDAIVVLEEEGNIIPLNTEWNWKRGYRVICSRKALQSLADLNGLQLRFYPSEFEMSVWRALGAVPHVIAFSETYLALQQGMVQAVTSPSNVIYDMKFVEVCKYVTRTNEFPQTLAFYMNKKRFQSLSKELQKALVDACNQAGSEYSAKVDENVEQVLAISKEDYSTVYFEPDMAPFISRARSFYNELKEENSMPSEFWDVMAAIEAAR